MRGEGRHRWIGIKPLRARIADVVNQPLPAAIAGEIRRNSDFARLAKLVTLGPQRSSSAISFRPASILAASRLSASAWELSCALADKAAITASTSSGFQLASSPFDEFDHVAVAMFGAAEKRAHTIRLGSSSPAIHSRLANPANLAPASVGCSASVSAGLGRLWQLEPQYLANSFFPCVLLSLRTSVIAPVGGIPSGPPASCALRRWRLGRHRRQPDTPPNPGRDDRRARLGTSAAPHRRRSVPAKSQC